MAFTGVPYDHMCGNHHPGIASEGKPVPGGTRWLSRRNSYYDADVPPHQLVSLRRGIFVAWLLKHLEPYYRCDWIDRILGLRGELKFTTIK